MKKIKWWKFIPRSLVLVVFLLFFLNFCNFLFLFFNTFGKNTIIKEYFGNSLSQFPLVRESWAVLRQVGVTAELREDSYDRNSGPGPSLGWTLAFQGSDRHAENCPIYKQN